MKSLAVPDVLIVELFGLIKNMTYKGYSITKEYYVPYLMGSDRHRWLVFKNCRNVWFNTLREAKEWVNKQINGK